jgi:nickel-dependent lactate racemase
MVEAVELLGSDKIYTIQTVLTASKEIYAAFSGDIHKAFLAAVEKANEINCCPITEKSDIVITCVPPPKDINLYQSQHALENGKLALKKDGIIIWVSRSRKGIGNDSFVQLLKSVETYEELMTSLKQGYKLGYHKSARDMGSDRIGRPDNTGCKVETVPRHPDRLE